MFWLESFSVFSHHYNFHLTLRWIFSFYSSFSLVTAFFHILRNRLYKIKPRSWWHSPSFELRAVIQIFKKAKVISLQIIHFFSRLVFFASLFFELIFSNWFFIYKNHNPLTKYLSIISLSIVMVSLILTIKERELIEHACQCLRKSFGMKKKFINQVGKNIYTWNTFSRCFENLSNAWKHTIHF